MGKTFDEIIQAQKGKVITMTIDQLESFHRDAFFAGHETSRYVPNISGSCKHHFIYTEDFKALREPEGDGYIGEVIERPCDGEMNIGRTYKKIRGLRKMEDMPVGTKFYAISPGSKEAESE